jgi:hypothetical protein
MLIAPGKMLTSFPNEEAGLTCVNGTQEEEVEGYMFKWHKLYMNVETASSEELVGKRTIAIPHLECCFMTNKTENNLQNKQASFPWKSV